jgi:NTE family protein
LTAKTARKRFDLSIKRLKTANFYSLVKDLRQSLPIRADEMLKTNGISDGHGERSIALALGGGAARGWAHIGVLRALDEAGIKVNMIAGTSIGALVGGCYLAGHLNELEDFARSLNRRRMFALMDWRLRGNGLLGGNRLHDQMMRYLNGIKIEDLSAPFVAVAAEIRTGHEVLITKGGLINAMRASYALPGVFEPVTSNGRVLVDGALVNPVPVSVCRNHERRGVVAINLNYDMFGRASVISHSAETPEHSATATKPASKLETTEGQRLGITGVMLEAFNIIQDRIARSRLAGDPPDVSVHPKLSHIGLTEFHRAGEAIEIGYQAMMARVSELERMMDAEQMVR